MGDEQECNIKLGSWTHDGDIIGLTLYDEKEQMDLTDFANSSSPYVATRQIEGTRVVKYYSCCAEPYISLDFKFALKRQFPTREDPKEQLLTNILGVPIAILTAFFFLRRGDNLREDSFKMRALNSTSSG